MSIEMKSNQGTMVAKGSVTPRRLYRPIALIELAHEQMPSGAIIEARGRLRLYPRRKFVGSPSRYALSVEDYSCCLPLIADKNLLTSIHAGTKHPCVSFVGEVIDCGRRSVLELKKVEPVNQEEDPLQFLPWSLCPRPELLPRLRQAIMSFQIKPLRRFLLDLFASDEILIPFLSLPASDKDHHSYPGGLLLHSLECLEQVAVQQTFPSHIQELGMAAALLHDVSKVMTSQPQGKKTLLGAVVEHDHLTLRILAPYLRNLEKQWQDGATALQYILTFKLHKGLRTPSMVIADVVATADRVSCAQDNERTAALSAPAWQRLLVGVHGKKVFRPQFTGPRLLPGDCEMLRCNG